MSIQARISKIPTVDNHSSYPDLYYYLSSFVHVDAGYESIRSIDYSNLSKVYAAILFRIMISLELILNRGGLCKKSLSLISATLVVLHKEKNKTTPSQDNINKYNNLLKQLRL